MSVAVDVMAMRRGPHPAVTVAVSPAATDGRNGWRTPAFQPGSGGLTATTPLERNPETFDLGVEADQTCWARAGAWVPD